MRSRAKVVGEIRIGIHGFESGARRVILVSKSDSAAKARPMGPHVLTWTELRKRPQKLEFPAGSETTRDVDKSRMAASEYEAASRRK